ncbi:MAG TPA: O-antigen ligase family protein [Candidatus Dormibacteraeota bacterium]|nr:O-antigen ligase family protein [Candidatus Dormibacteraeota bacterium]
MRESALSTAFERLPLMPLVALGGTAVVAVLLGPESLTMALIAGAGMMVIALRPQWGVAMILILLMVQYGTRQTSREGVAGIAALVPGGEGLLTINNILGLFLALLLAYQIFRDNDWSFLHNRQLQLIALITLALAFAGFVSGIDTADAVNLGLRATSGQDPTRLLVSRALFLVLFVFFLRAPRDLRMIVAIFVVLTVTTAWSGSEASFTFGGRSEVADYRAGGVDVLIGSTQNPNRLAMICTLALIFIWEYSQAHSLRRWWWATGSVALLLVMTVFLSASRGGVLGLGFACLLLFVRRDSGAGRIVYSIAIAALGIVLISQVVPEQALERISNIPGISANAEEGEGGGSIERRGYTYGIGLQIWKTAPIIGIGPGNWPYVRFITDPARSPAAPHSSFLEALVEGGLLTLSLYLILFAVTVRDLLRCERSPAAMAAATRDDLAWLVTATRIAVVTFLVFSLFGDLWDLIFSYFLLGVAGVIIDRYRPLALTPASAPLPA